jgi:hypothetical protein
MKSLLFAAVNLFAAVACTSIPKQLVRTAVPSSRYSFPNFQAKRESNTFIGELDLYTDDPTGQCAGASQDYTASNPAECVALSDGGVIQSVNVTPYDPATSYIITLYSELDCPDSALAGTTGDTGPQCFSGNFFMSMTIVSND